MSMAKRTSRFKREPAKVGGITIQPRDHSIIQTVYDYRFVNSDHIAALTEGSDQQIRRRLQKLFHHGYLDRPPLQQVDPLHPGSQKMVYGLSDRGAELLAEKNGYDIAKIRWREKNTQIKHHYFQHVLMLSEFRACLTLALADHPSARMVFWRREDPEALKDTVKMPARQSKQRQVSIIPDGYFCIEDPRGYLYFFIEADRSTMTHKRYLRKMKAYWWWWKQGGHTKAFDINAFRVLTVTKSEKRAENLRVLTKEADERGIGSEMFWFTSALNYSIENPGQVLKPLWQTPKNETPHHLLE